MWWCKMVKFQLLNKPGYVQDLNYIFCLKFLNIVNFVNSHYLEKFRTEEIRRMNDVKYRFGDVSDDLFLFYYIPPHQIPSFMTKFGMDTFRKHFLTDFDFGMFINDLSDTDKYVRNMITYFMNVLPQEKLEECYTSKDKLFSYIKETNFSWEIKSRLYEFFLKPEPFFQLLKLQLMEKEVMLADYYNENMQVILDAHNKLNYDKVVDCFVGRMGRSHFYGTNRVAYFSYCLLNNHLIKVYYFDDYDIFFLGTQYDDVIDDVNSKKDISLEKFGNAVSEPSRIKILQFILEQGEITCKDLEKAFSFSGSTAYHHITTLVRIGLVNSRSEGKAVFYSINREYFKKVTELLNKFVIG